MKILLVNHLLDAVTGGGTAERTYQIGRFLAREGVECTVLTLDIGITPGRRAGLGDAKIVALPCLNERYFIPRLSSGLAMRLVANADVVHLSGHWTLLNVLVFRACRKLGKPYLFCPAGALQPFGRSFWLKRLYDVIVGHRLAKLAAACVAVTEAERTDFSACGVPDERVVVIPNGIDPEAYRLDDESAAVATFRREAGVGDSRFILFLGRLNLIKGPDLLLDAFFRLASDLHDVHLVIAGPDGGMRSQLEEAAIGRFKDRVHFIGYVGGRGKLAALHAATLLAIPSRREAMSIVVLEGGVCGCPVLFTDACGLDEIAEQDAGVMVPVSVESLAEALGRMLREPESTKVSAEHLRGIIEKDYLWEAQAQRYISLSRRVLSQSLHFESPSHAARDSSPDSGINE